jgi:hypothetical protein
MKATLSVACWLVTSAVLIAEGRAQPATAPQKKPTPDKPVRDGDLLRRTEEEKRKLLIPEGYSLARGESLRRIPPPFVEARWVYYRESMPDQAAHLPDGPASMFFHWKDGELTLKYMKLGGPNGPGHNLTGLLHSVLGVQRQNLEGPEDIIWLKPLPGDWVVQEDAKMWPNRTLPQIENILKKDFQLNVRLEFHEVIKPVYVARGDYAYTGLPDSKLQIDLTRPNADFVEVFEDDAYRQSKMGQPSSGSLRDFFDHVAVWSKVSIIDETTNPPLVVHWRHHFERGKVTTEENPDRILPNITKQTGLNFTKEDRPVQVLFVTPIEPR